MNSLLFAQSLTEYGFLSTLSAGIGYLTETARAAFDRLDGRDWMIVGGAAVALLFLLSRRSPRF